MKHYILLSFILFCHLGIGHTQEKDINVIYGDHHLFTVETPDNWINDKGMASSFGLTNFFYCLKDNDKKPRSYMFANGIDKANEEESLQSFIDGDIKEFKLKYPNAQVTKGNLSHTPPIIDAILLSYDNLYDRYKEEVVYLETDNSFIILSFAAFSEDDYKNYSPVFDSEFIGKFQYLGNDPSPFLEWQNKNH
jgi:hypothetical protein